MSYRPTTELGALTSALLADLERMRPGLSPTASEAEIAEQCQARATLRLPELYSEYQGEATPDSDSQLALYRREIDQLMIPRYVKLAQQQNLIERSQMRGVLYNRVSYAVLFFVLGIAVIWAPFIPIWEKWLPFALACIAPLLSPWLPNLYGALRLRQHRLSLGLLVMDLDEAGRTLPLPPLSSAALPAHAAAQAGPDSVSQPVDRSTAALSGQKKESNGNSG